MRAAATPFVAMDVFGVVRAPRRDRERRSTFLTQRPPPAGHACVPVGHFFNLLQKYSVSKREQKQHRVLVFSLASHAPAPWLLRNPALFFMLGTWRNDLALAQLPMAMNSFDDERLLYVVGTFALLAMIDVNQIGTLNINAVNGM
jgi:hypothetical protein